MEPANSRVSPDQYRIERERRGTQASVAALLRVDPQTISRRERGEIPITHEAALALLSLPRKRKRTPRPQNDKSEPRAE
jgi:transcriptional regulator with XRE-family HTH domain